MGYKGNLNKKKVIGHELQLMAIMEVEHDELDAEPNGEAQSPSGGITSLDVWECGAD
jgi:hypothetical protein